MSADLNDFLAKFDAEFNIKDDDIEKFQEKAGEKKDDEEEISLSKIESPKKSNGSAIKTQEIMEASPIKSKSDFITTDLSFDTTESEFIPNPPSQEVQEDFFAALQNLKQKRVTDITTIQALLIENARLKAKLSCLEHVDVKIAELGSKLEILFERYLSSEELRRQQAEEIAALRQNVILMKSRRSRSQYHKSYSSFSRLDSQSSTDNLSQFLPISK